MNAYSRNFPHTYIDYIIVHPTPRHWLILPEGTSSRCPCKLDSHGPNLILAWPATWRWLHFCVCFLLICQGVPKYLNPKFHNIPQLFTCGRVLEYYTYAAFPAPQFASTTQAQMLVRQFFVEIALLFGAWDEWWSDEGKVSLSQLVCFSY